LGNWEIGKLRYAIYQFTNPPYNWGKMSGQYILAEWRLLNTGARDGATNMAIDEAILEAVMAGRVRPTLRFYAWNPPCLSLGFGQPAADADREACTQRGWDIVRRPTGGQAILHVDELTYSVCAPLDEPRVAGSIVESYGRLTAGLLAGLQLLNLEPAEAKPEYPEPKPGLLPRRHRPWHWPPGHVEHGEKQVKTRANSVSPWLDPRPWENPDPRQVSERGPVCFDGPARYEITIDGRKLVGSAQSRRLGGVLQHGTLPLEGDITRIIDGLALEPAERIAARVRLGRRALTLESALGQVVAFAQAAEAMAAGFAQALTLDLVPGELTAREWAAVEYTRAQKYANHEWTFKR